MENRQSAKDKVVFWCHKMIARPPLPGIGRNRMISFSGGRHLSRHLGIVLIGRAHP